MKLACPFAFLTLIIIFQTFGYSQTIDYQIIDELPQVRTEKIEPDGSVWYSYVKQDTFHLDSISPVGQIFQKTHFPIDTLGSFINYAYNTLRGVIITRTIAAPQSCQDCLKASIAMYNNVGIKQWESFWEGTSQFNHWADTKPRIINDSLFLFGKQGGEDPAEIYYLNMDWQGNITNDTYGYLTFCDFNDAVFDNTLYVINRTDCSDGNYQPRPAVMYEYDKDYNRNTTQFFKIENWNNYPAFYGIDLTLINPTTLFGQGTGPYTYEPQNILIKLNNNNTQTWHNTSEILRTSETTSVKDVIRLDSGFLFFLYNRIQNSTNITQIMTLIWVNDNVQFPEVIYTDTIPHHILNAEMNTLEMGVSNTVFINYSYSQYVPNSSNISHGYNLKITIDKSITSIRSIKKSDFNIFPNPAKQKLNIHSTQKGILEVYDLTGRLVSKTFLQNPDMLLDISSYNNGIYILKFTANSGTSNTQKLLISK